MTKQRITLISLVGLLVFGLLIVGQILYQKNWVDTSILKQSQQIHGVLSVKVVEVNGQKELDVVTSRVSDLPKTSEKLEKLAGAIPIRYFDERSFELEQILNQMQFALQESIIKGNFTEMEQNVKLIADKSGVQLDLNMDSDQIYLVLTKGETQLVTVIERHSQAKFLRSEKS
ncbi:MAG: hypothetical protein WA131_02475 [Desulfitobacteriaceae bacterium]